MPTEQTNGNYGLLPLITSPTDWETLYGHERIPPNDPCYPPILTDGTSAAYMKNIIHNHQNEVKKYDLMINTEAALKQ